MWGILWFGFGGFEFFGRRSTEGCRTRQSHRTDKCINRGSISLHFCFSKCLPSGLFSETWDEMAKSESQIIFLSDQNRQQLLELGSDLTKLWSHSTTSAETKKRILRSVLVEIGVNSFDDPLT